MQTDLLMHQFQGLPQKHRALFSLAAIAAITASSGAWAISDGSQSWKQLQSQGTDALDANKYWLAEPRLKQALIIAGAYGDADLRLAKSLGELGRLYTIRGRFSEAEPYLEEALHVQEQAFGPNNGDIIPPMASLVKFYIEYGTAAKADPLAERMLDFVEGRLQDPNSIPHGKLKMKKGQALEGWVGDTGPVARDPAMEWAIACDAVGDAYRLHGKYEMADRAYKAALDLKSTALGKDHLALASSYDNLGRCCFESNDLTGAESYYKEALAVTEKILARGNPVTYARLDRLAKTYIKEGKYQPAEDLYLEAQDFWNGEGTLSSDKPRAVYALGSLYIDERRYEAAAQTLRHALGLAEEVNGPASATLVPYLQRYAYSLYFLKRKPEYKEMKGRAGTISGAVD